MKSALISVVLLIVFSPIVSLANQFYVSPTGTAGGTGSSSNPWDLQTALNQPAAVQPNDTIWLRGGTYAGFFTSNLNGSPGQYIYVLQYPNERATLVDNRQYASGATLQVNGSWTIYKDFEVTNSNTNRSSLNSASFRPMGLQVQAPNTKFINLIIHDTGHGFGFWKEAIDAEIYGCLIYNCGIANSPGNYNTHGHGIYTQNNTGIKRIRHNMIFNQFGFGIHAFPDPGNLNGYDIDGNTLFNNGVLTNDTMRYNNILINPYPPYTAENITVQNNLSYDSKNAYTYTSILEADIFLGSTNVNCSNLSMENNHLMGKGRAGVALLQWDTIHYSNNISYYLTNGSAAIALPSGGSYTANQWDNNTYFTGANTSNFSIQYSPLVNFSTWQTTTGFDANSTYLTANPSSTDIFIQPNLYENGRANVIIYNWNALSTVSIDLSSIGLADGQSFEIVDAQNYFGTPIYAGVYAASSPTIDLAVSGLSPAPPLGLSALPTTAPEFATFIVVPDVQDASVQTTLPMVDFVEAYPNPADGQLIIEIQATQSTEVAVQLFDSFGRELHSINEEIAGNAKLELETRAFSAGVYFLKVATDVGTVMKRIRFI